MDTKTELTETEKLCVQRNRAKGRTWADIAERLGLEWKVLIKLYNKK